MRCVSIKGFPELTSSPVLQIQTNPDESAQFQCAFTQLAADVDYVVEFYIDNKMVAMVTNDSSPVVISEREAGDLRYGSSVSTYTTVYRKSPKHSVSIYSTLHKKSPKHSVSTYSTVLR
jgi:hypothetical protein